MSNEATQHQPQHHERADENDRQWAKRMADERERRDVHRINELKQTAEVTQAGVAKIGADVEELRAKVDALHEKANPAESPYAFDRFIMRMDANVRRVLPYVTVAGAAAAVGYGTYRGGKALRASMQKRVDVDVTIKPVGEPVSVPKR